MTESKPSEEEVQNILIRLRAERMYHWRQMLWTILFIETMLGLPLLLRALLS